MNTKTKPSSWRIYFFVLIFMLIAGYTVERLFQITLYNSDSFREKTKAQYEFSQISLQRRGNIYFSDRVLDTPQLAVVNKSFKYVYTTSKLGDSYADIAKVISPILNIEEADLAQNLRDNKDKSYYEIKKDITKEQAEKISAIDNKIVTSGNKAERSYNFSGLGSHVIGFFGYEGNARKGQYGVEGYYDEILRGLTRDKNISQKATLADTFKGFFNIYPKKKDNKAVNDEQDIIGSDIILTIDNNIQEFSEAKLNSVMARWQATGGSIIIQDPKTGAILAMASSPSFNPNNYSDYGFINYSNKSIQDTYEPGSTFKAITMAAGIDKGLVNGDTTYTDSGEVQEAGFSIKNFDSKAHGVQTMRQVLEKSLNTGVIFVERLLGEDNFLNYVVAFGFGQKTGVDLAGEIAGSISNLYTGRKVNFYTASFGQGIAVTPLQLINAFSAIANGGKLMKPYIVKEIRRSDGTIEVTKPLIIGVPIKEKTSLQLRSMLVDVVEKGFDRAKVKGYDVAGKTGTAQIADSKGGYLESDQFIHNFVGFAPAYDPQFVILIKIDRPKGITFAADSLSPVFSELAKFMVHYLNIPPAKQL